MIGLNNEEKRRYNELGNFLRIRRNKILPSQVGLSIGIRRRTPGLRREEVAQLASVGLTWYTWLEQGRQINVSDQVLESLAKVLMLDQEERKYLFALAMKPLPFENYFETIQINDKLQHILNSLTTSPAYIMDQKWNIIGWNKSANLIFGDFNQINPPERNVVKMMFCRNEYMELFDDWESHAKAIVARFRVMCSKFIDDPGFAEFANNLKVKSPDFNLWWSTYDVQGMGDVIKELTHPIVGKLVFEFSSFDVSDNPNLKMLIHTPVLETGTIDKMKRLITN